MKRKSVVIILLFLVSTAFAQNNLISVGVFYSKADELTVEIKNLAEYNVSLPLAFQEADVFMGGIYFDLMKDHRYTCKMKFYSLQQLDSMKYFIIIPPRQSYIKRFRAGRIEHTYSSFGREVVETEHIRFIKAYPMIKYSVRSPSVKYGFYRKEIDINPYSEEDGS